MTAGWPAGLRIEAICFDAGDTLIFDEPSLAFRAAAALDSCAWAYDPAALTDAITSMLRYGEALYSGGLQMSAAEFAAACAGQLLSGLRMNADETAARRLAWSFAEQPCCRGMEPGAAALLGELKRRGFKLGVVSDWEPDLPDVLDGLEILNFFDCVSVSSVVGAAKPDAKLFRHALDCLGVPAENALHVGDYAEIDVAGALSVGMRACLYDRRGLYRQTKTLSGVPYAATLAELRGILLSLTPPTPNRRL